MRAEVRGAVRLAGAGAGAAEALHLYLDYRPDDWAARGELARQLNAAGQFAEGRYYAFTAGHGLHPMPPGTMPYGGIVMLGWTWWRTGMREPWDIDPNGFQVGSLWCAVHQIPPGRSCHAKAADWHDRFATRQQAERALQKTLEDRDYAWRR